MPNGQRMHYLLGKSVREKYADLFSGTPKFSDYEVTSSQVQRTMLSAYSHMMGIYPLGSGPKVTNDVEATQIPPFLDPASSFLGDDALEAGYKPIPVNVIDGKTDVMFMRGFDNICQKASDQVKKESAIRAASKQRIDLVAPLAKILTEAGYSSQ